MRTVISKALFLIIALFQFLCDASIRKRCTTSSMIKKAFAAAFKASRSHTTNMRAFAKRPSIIRW